MKFLKLRTKITLISALILVGMACAFTVISVKDAKTTYENHFDMSLSDGMSLNLNGKKIEFGKNGNSSLGEILEFAGEVAKVGEDAFLEDYASEDSVNQIFSDASSEFTRNSIIVMAVLVFTGVLIIYVCVGIALKPAQKLSKSMETINTNNLCQKLEEPKCEDEIGSLTKSFNHLLGRLSSSFDSQKNFAANAAHELKTPLATMKAGIQVLEMEETPSLEDYQETVEVVKVNTERLIHIVEDLTNLTKQDNLQFSDRIELTEVIEDCVKELSSITKRCGVTVRVGNCEGIILGNHTLVYRAIFNLMENAVKYNRENGMVFVTSKIEGQYVRVVIEDNGVGIPREALPHIFDAFYRVDKSRSRQIGGSGLGLALVKNIIDKHNGKIAVTSEMGKGTTFEVEICRYIGT